jgi:hypothetical protein
LELNFVQLIAIYALPVIFAITLHEAAHGYVARHFGDMTAFQEGRVSIEPYGFIIVLALLFTGVLGYLLWPAIAVLMRIIAALFDLSAGDLARLTGII